jgi:hypothetical protein
MFRFTIREVVLVTVIVALSAGWLVSFRQLCVARLEAQRLEFDLVVEQSRVSSYEGQLRAAGIELRPRERD